jgi:hypothetical protein
VNPSWVENRRFRFGNALFLSRLSREFQREASVTVTSGGNFGRFDKTRGFSQPPAPGLPKICPKNSPNIFQKIFGGDLKGVFAGFEKIGKVPGKNKTFSRRISPFYRQLFFFSQLRRHRADTVTF